MITFLTDFGLDSTYVGSMKGVVYSLYPQALMVDITHSVQPQNILEGAFLLYTSHRDFPSGTICVAVVDPGVGTQRRAICLHVPEVGYFVGPDNGLFSYLLDAYQQVAVREITNPAFMHQPVSATFHGRDIFAPTAAMLARGEPFEQVGPLLENHSLVRLPAIWPLLEGHELNPELDLTAWRSFFQHPAYPAYGPPPIMGQVVHIDRYGNLITNISRRLFEKMEISTERALIEVERFYQIPSIHPTYGYGSRGQVIALFSSGGFLEIAKVNGRADQSSGKLIQIGQTVRLLNWVKPGY